MSVEDVEEGRRKKDVVEWMVEEVVGGGRGKGLYSQWKVLFATHVRGEVRRKEW